MLFWLDYTVFAHRLGLAVLRRACRIYPQSSWGRQILDSEENRKFAKIKQICSAAY